MNERVDHPKHYTSHASGVECIELTRCMDFCTGNAVKYLFRHGLKNGLEDLEKAAWYLKEAQRVWTWNPPTWRGEPDDLERFLVAESEGPIKEAYRHLFTLEVSSGRAPSLVDAEAIVRAEVARRRSLEPRPPRGEG